MAKRKREKYNFKKYLLGLSFLTLLLGVCLAGYYARDFFEPKEESHIINRPFSTPSRLNTPTPTQAPLMPPILSPIPQQTKKVINPQKEICKEKVRLFKELALQRGYPQIYARLGELKCLNPESYGDSRGDTLEGQLDDLQREAENRKFWETQCASQGKIYNSQVGAGCM